MNLYYAQASLDTVTLDLMVVAGDVETAIEIWRRVQIAAFMTSEDLEGATCEPYLVDLHIQRPTTGYIEWGTFKFVPVDLP